MAGVASRDGVTNCMTGARCPNGTSPPPRLQHLNLVHPESKLSDRETYFKSEYNEILLVRYSTDINLVSFTILELRWYKSLVTYTVLLRNVVWNLSHFYSRVCFDLTTTQ